MAKLNRLKVVLAEKEKSDKWLAGNNKKKIAVSLFCELLPERMRLFLHNHPEAKGFCGDIWELNDDIVKYNKE